MTCPFSLLQVHNFGVAIKKLIGNFSQIGKVPVFFPQQRFSDLKRSVEAPIDILSQGHRKFVVVSPLAEVKYLESDDFDEIAYCATRNSQYASQLAANHFIRTLRFCATISIS